MVIYEIPGYAHHSEMEYELTTMVWRCIKKSRRDDSMILSQLVRSM